jgi:GH24 family phage-related lysozyme (muramidase)
MKISSAGVELIASFEGCKLTAYWDATGKVWTIGYGHTKNVNKGDAITKEQAKQFLADDCADAERQVMRFDIIYHWNQNEFDALVSFAFNVGSIDQLTAKGTRTRAEIAEKLPAYNKSGGVLLNGLTRRRNAEKKLFLTPVSTSNQNGSNNATENEGVYVAKVTANRLNVRTGPGLNYGNLSEYPQLAKGNLVDVLGGTVKGSNNTTWNRVKIANKYEGYVCAKYITRV